MTDLVPSVQLEISSRPGLLSQFLADARRRSRLSLEQAAGELHVPAGRLAACERGAERPDAALLGRMGVLYPVDTRDLMLAAELQDRFPAVARRISSMESVVQTVRQWLRDHPDLPRQNARWNAAARDLEACRLLECEPAEAAERDAKYFSIGHLSDRLLGALQDPEFHNKIEALAKKYEEETGAPPGDTPPPAPGEEKPRSGGA